MRQPARRQFQLAVAILGAIYLSASCAQQPDESANDPSSTLNRISQIAAPDRGDLSFATPNTVPSCPIALPDNTVGAVLAESNGNLLCVPTTGETSTIYGVSLNSDMSMLVAISTPISETEFRGGVLRSGCDTAFCATSWTIDDATIFVRHPNSGPTDHSNYLINNTEPLMQWAANFDTSILR